MIDKDKALKLVNHKLNVIEGSLMKNAIAYIKTKNHLGDVSERLAEFEKVLDNLSKPMAYEGVGSIEEQFLSLESKVEEVSEQLRRRNKLFHSRICRMESHWTKERVGSIEEKVTLLEETCEVYEIRIKTLEKLVERMNTKLSNSIRTGILKGE